MPLSARERARQSLRVHAPALADVPLVELRHGLENTAFLAGDLVLRAARNDSVPAEARLLQVVGAHVSLPVPVVRFVDPDARVLAYPRLPGRPLLGRTCAAVTDPALDFARLYRDFGPVFLADAPAAYGHRRDDAFGERVVFFARCAALEDLAFGRETGRSEYREAAERSLGRLFP